MTVKPPVAEVVKGMPPAQQGRAKALYLRGIQQGLLQAADELEKLSDHRVRDMDDYILYPLIQAWISATREAAGKEGE